MVKCCGTCRFHAKKDEPDWWCDNPEAEAYADFTDYQDAACPEYEPRASRSLFEQMQRGIDQYEKRFERYTF